MFYLVFMGILTVLTVGAFLYFRAEQRNVERHVAEGWYEQRGQTPEGWPKLAKLGTLAGFVVIALGITAMASVHAVPAGSEGVVYQFGNIVGQRASGLVITAPWQSVKKANVQVQRHTFEKLDSFSAETQDVFISATINYRVDPKDIQDLYRNVGPDYFDKLVPNRVNQLFKDETVKYKAVEIAPNREVIRKNVAEKLRVELATFSIYVEDLLIDNISFSKAFTQAIEQKQIATQDAQTAQNRVKEAEYKAAQVVKAAEGEAKAYRLKQRTLTPLIVQQNAIDKLNPNVQVIVTDGNTLLLNPSDLIKTQKAK